MTDLFWKTLFDPGEATCFAATIYGTGVMPVDMGAIITSQFFSINPLATSRKDENVLRYRNILLEFDIGSPDEQLAALNSVPYSTLVWSGGKSHHAIISLEQPLKTRQEYDRLVRQIFNKVPKVDRSVKNPSRLSRAPGVIRDNGNLQELKDIVVRRSRAELEEWLGPEPEHMKSTVPTRRSLAIAPWTRYFLLFGAEPGTRNSSCFRAACDLLRHGYTEDEVYERCSEVVDLSETELRQVIASARVAAARG